MTGRTGDLWRVFRVELGQLRQVDLVLHLLHEARAPFVVRRVAGKVALWSEPVAVRAIPAHRGRIVLVHFLHELRGGDTLENLHILEHLLGGLILPAGDLRHDLRDVHRAELHQAVARQRHASARRRGRLAIRCWGCGGGGRRRPSAAGGALVHDTTKSTPRGARIARRRVIGNPG